MYGQISIFKTTLSNKPNARISIDSPKKIVETLIADYRYILIFCGEMKKKRNAKQLPIGLQMVGVFVSFWIHFPFYDYK